MPEFHTCGITNLVFTTTMLNGFATNYPVRTVAGVLYFVYVDDNGDLQFRKSTDNGLTWSSATQIFSSGAGIVTSVAVWYDRWSGISAGLIHIAYTETLNNDTNYRSIDTENSDTLSTATVIFAGVSEAQGGHLSITRARGGNLFCKSVIDAGAEGGFFRLLNADVPNGAWASRTVDETIATTDQMILVPGFAADNQDILAMFWDASANEISRKIHDDSANSWAETSIATSMVDAGISTFGSPQFAAAVDLANSQIVMVAWSDTDIANADLRCWKITESAITEVTNVVLNSTDDQGYCGICLDTLNLVWYVFYAGNSDGSENWNNAVRFYYKTSLDSGSNWSAQLQAGDDMSQVLNLFINPISTDGHIILQFFSGNTSKVMLRKTARRSVSRLGI